MPRRAPTMPVPRLPPARPESTWRGSGLTTSAPSNCGLVFRVSSPSMTTRRGGSCWPAARSSPQPRRARHRAMEMGVLREPSTSSSTAGFPSASMTPRSTPSAQGSSSAKSRPSTGARLQLRPHRDGRGRRAHPAAGLPGSSAARADGGGARRRPRDAPRRPGPAQDGIKPSAIFTSLLPLWLTAILLVLAPKFFSEHADPPRPARAAARPGVAGGRRRL